MLSLSILFPDSKEARFVSLDAEQAIHFLLN